MILLITSPIAQTIFLFSPIDTFCLIVLDFCPFPSEFIFRFSAFVHRRPIFPRISAFVHQKSSPMSVGDYCSNLFIRSLSLSDIYSFLFYKFKFHYLNSTNYAIVVNWEASIRSKIRPITDRMFVFRFLYSNLSKPAYDVSWIHNLIVSQYFLTFFHIPTLFQ